MDLIWRHDFFKASENTVINAYIVLAVNAVLILLSLFLCKGVIIPYKDFKTLRKEHFGFLCCDITVIALVISLAQIVCSCFFVEKFINHEFYVYASLSVFLLFMYMFSLFLNLVRIKDNIRFLTSPLKKYKVKTFIEDSNIIKRSSSKSIEKIMLCYQKPADFLRCELEYQNIFIGKAFSKVLFFCVIAAIFIFIMSLISTKDMLISIGAINLILCLSVPSGFVVVFFGFLRSKCKNLLKKGAMVSKYEDFKRLSNISGIILDAKDLFPSKFTEIKEIKVFKGNLLDEAIIYAGSIVKSVSSTLELAFDNTVNVHHKRIRKADSIKYIDKKGLVASVNGKRVLIGNTMLLKEFGVSVPAKIYQNGRCDDVVFVAINGDLVVLFYVYYRYNKLLESDVKKLAEEGIKIWVTTNDPNITEDKISKKFKIPKHMVYIISENQAKDYENLMEEGCEDDADIVTTGKTFSLLRAITTGIIAKNNVVLALIIQIMSIIACVTILGAIVIFSKTSVISVYDVFIYNLFLFFSLLVILFRRK